MKKKLFSLIMAVSMLIAMLPLTANALVVGDWEIEVSNGEATIIGYTGVCANKMILPTMVGNYKVVGIDDQLMYDESIFDDNVSEVVVPEGYRSIKGYVFENLRKRLKELSLPTSLEVLDVSFIEFNELTEIAIPSRVKEIKFMQFARCENLEYVRLSEGLQVIGGDAFAGCEKLKEIKIPNSTICICQGAFGGCNSLKEIVIPDSVIYYGFSSLPKATQNKHNVLCGAVIHNCANLETAIIGNGVTFIDSGELSDCPKLTSFHLGSSITHIYDYGISKNNPNIKTAIFPEGIQWFGSASLKNCENLEAVVFPKSISRLGDFETFTQNGKPLPKLYVYGYAGSEADKFAVQNGFPFVDISVATPTNSRVTINGKEVAFTAYNIGGNNYFKLRDIAAATNGTGKNFNVGWDGANNAISLTSKSSYNSVGGELTVNTSATAVEPQISNPKIFVDGKLTTFMAFNINDNNYIKLRDIGEVFDFAVDWNSATGTIEINTNRNYTE